MGNDFYHGVCNHTYNMAVQRYRKILKISPHMYKPPKPVRQKTLLKNHPSKYKPPGDLYLENCPQMQSKTKPKR